MKNVPFYFLVIFLLCACGNTHTNNEVLLGSALFESVYVPYAKAEMRTSFSDVTSFLENGRYDYSVQNPSPDVIGEITVRDGDDYVYFSFLERSSNFYTIMTVSYYQASSNSEVSLSNYSPYGDHKYDTLNTHKIGNSVEEVATVDEQRLFLFGEI